MSILHVDQLSFKYAEEYVFCDVSMELQQGIIKIIGRNGAGKTTLLKLLSGELNPSSGHIHGVRRVATVSNYIQIPDDIPLKALITKSMWQFFDDTIPSYVDFIRKQSHKKIKQLSTGQQRLFEIFFALTSQCDMLILDEITNGLDYNNTKKIIELINELTAIPHILFVSHHLQDYLSLSSGSYLVIDSESKKISQQVEMNQAELVDFFLS